MKLCIYESMLIHRPTSGLYVSAISYKITRKIVFIICSKTVSLKMILEKSIKNIFVSKFRKPSIIFVPNFITVELVLA
jgi:hypothetical protein